MSVWKNATQNAIDLKLGNQKSVFDQKTKPPRFMKHVYDIDVVVKPGEAYTLDDKWDEFVTMQKTPLTRVVGAPIRVSPAMPVADVPSLADVLAGIEKQKTPNELHDFIDSFGDGALFTETERKEIGDAARARLIALTAPPAAPPAPVTPPAPAEPVVPHIAPPPAKGK